MPLFSNIRDTVTDFLFPKSRKVLELEALSAGELLKSLPPAEAIKREEVFAIFDYDHPLVKELIWELKYNGNKIIATKLGEILYDTVVEELSDLGVFTKWPKVLLVPVPVSGRRRFERGWNQSELLCEEIKKRDTEKRFKYVQSQLVKNYHTESQTKTGTRQERLKNLKNSMRILNPAAVLGECVVVIDDVTTTGATFAEAERALREAGAKKIICLAIAH